MPGLPGLLVTACSHKAVIAPEFTAMRKPYRSADDRAIETARRHHSGAAERHPQRRGGGARRETVEAVRRYARPGLGFRRTAGPAFAGL
jgi:hypothetical protein